MIYLGILITTGGDAILRKSISLSDVEMTRGVEHANKAHDRPSYMANEHEQDKFSMVQPFYADGAAENPSGCSTNAGITGSDETGQSSSEVSPITSRSQININIEPKENITYEESNTRSPKGSNPHGDGAPILGFRRRIQSTPKVGQRNYSTGSAAVIDGTAILSELKQLENGKFTGLYKVLATEEMLLRAYRKIKSKPGNMTSGSDNVTLDGFSMKTIQEIITSLKDETFVFKPVRREFIPKKNGKMRPLGVPSPRDKIVQEAMRILLEIVYEPIFCDSSHGFRPKRGCHSALKEISTWNGHTWCIEGGIKGFFDNVDHHILEQLLCKKIQDQQFIDLYWKLVKAGYVEKGNYFDSPLGVPQGGIVSPILSNIYLHELDIWIEKYTDQTLRYYIKSISKVNPKIVKYSTKLSELGAQYHLYKDKEILKEIKALRKERNDIPSRIRTGVRIKYTRYADDWIVGMIGPKDLAISFKNEISTFLETQLKITLSPEKTKISHFGEDRIKFLGALLSIPNPTHNKVVIRNSIRGKVFARVNHTRMNFNLPLQDILNKLADAGFLKNYKIGGKLTTNAITKWIFLDHRTILLRYNAIVNGLLNYYSFADNFSEFHTIINFILRHSCAKTLARKFRLNGRKAAFEKFGEHLSSTEEGKLKAIKFKMLETYAKTRKFNAEDIWINPFDVLKWRLETHSGLSETCWVCGSEEDIEMHHVKHLRKGFDPNQKGFTQINYVFLKPKTNSGMPTLP
jgi:group II intron reverse transcriptase/maturase